MRAQRLLSALFQLYDHRQGWTRSVRFLTLTTCCFLCGTDWHYVIAFPPHRFAAIVDTGLDIAPPCRCISLAVLVLELTRAMAHCDCCNCSGPSAQSVPLLILPIVMLVDTCHARACARDVVQRRLGHFKTHPQPLKPGGHSAAQIVDAPW